MITGFWGEAGYKFLQGATIETHEEILLESPIINVFDV